MHKRNALKALWASGVFLTVAGMLYAIIFFDNEPPEEVNGFEGDITQARLTIAQAPFAEEKNIFSSNGQEDNLRKLTFKELKEAGTDVLGKFPAGDLAGNTQMYVAEISDEALIRLVQQYPEKVIHTLSMIKMAMEYPHIVVFYGYKEDGYYSARIVISHVPDERSLDSSLIYLQIIPDQT